MRHRAVERSSPGISVHPALPYRLDDFDFAFEQIVDQIGTTNDFGVVGVKSCLCLSHAQFESSPGHWKDKGDMVN